jgi:magnesium transporter
VRILKSADLDQVAELRRRNEFFWLDLDDPDPATIQRLGERLELHELAIEDTQEFGQRPKVDVYDEDQVLLVYFGGGQADDRTPEAVEVHLHISSRFILSVHREPCALFERLDSVFVRRPLAGESHLVYRIIDALTDSVLDVLDDVASQVDAYQAEVFNRPRARDRDQMALLRRSLQSFRRVMVSQRQVFDRTVERIGFLQGMDGEMATYYRDVGDHLWRAVDEIESARESLQGMLDTYTNEVQERLTIVATIFLPLSVITGFFGQNFNWLVNHIGSVWAFWGVGVGAMLVSIATIVFWLLHSGLYTLPRRRVRLPKPRLRVNRAGR